MEESFAGVAASSSSSSRGVEALQVLDSDPALVQALRSVGELWGSESEGGEKRLELRGEVERHALGTCRAVLEALQEMNTLLERVQQDVKAVRGCCDDMEGQLNMTRTAAGSLTQRTAQLKTARASNALRGELAARFVAVFTLSPEERTALTAGAMTEDFFAALERVHAISNKARMLVRTTLAQQAGLDVLDRMGDLADAAYDQITAFAQKEFRQLSGESPEPPHLLCTALQLLARERPSLMKFCMDEVQQVRKQALVTAFVRALTQGGPNGVPAPMDASSSDPVRHVGDMLAWFHQTLASENELVTNLFGKAAVASGAVVAVVGPSLTPCCGPFRSRLELVLKEAHLDIVLAHELRSLLQFYRVSLAVYVSADCPFGVLLAEFQLHFRNLFDNLVATAARDADAVQTVHPDLGPPSLLHKAVYHLSRIGETLDNSLLPAEERTSAVLLEPLVNPLVSMCVRTAANLSLELGSVFLINCFVLLRDVLAPHGRHCRPLLDSLEAQISTAVEGVADSEVEMFLTRAQLLQSLKALSDLASTGESPLSAPGLDAKSLSESVRILETAVLGQGDLVLAMGACGKIQDDVIRGTVKRLVAAQLVRAYSELHALVHNSSNNYPDAGQIMRYSPEQFRTLLEN